MKTSVWMMTIATLVFVQPGHAADMTTFIVKPGVGNNTFTAVFDAVIGERITAISSAVGCTLTVDEEKLEGKGSCSVALTSILVDGDETKTKHFHQWATNKNSDPKDCTFDLEIPSFQLSSPVEPKTPVPFTTEGAFTVCGRTRDDGGPEHMTGTIIYLPAGTYGKSRTLRIRAHIEGFNRDQYKVGPAHTSGWLARVQQLADVVATEGTIDVNIFATSPSKEEVGKSNNEMPKGG